MKRRRGASLNELVALRQWWNRTANELSRHASDGTPSDRAAAAMLRRCARELDLLVAEHVQPWEPGARERARALTEGSTDG